MQGQSTLECHQSIVEALLRRVSHARKADQLLAAAIKASSQKEVVRHESGGCYMSYCVIDAVYIKVRNY